MIVVTCYQICQCLECFIKGGPAVLYLLVVGYGVNFNNTLVMIYLD